MNPSPQLLEQLVALLTEQLAPRVAELLADKLPASERGSPWLNVDETAEYLRLRARDGEKWSRDAVHKLTAARAIPHHRIGSRILCRRDELDKWLEERYEGPPRAVGALRALP